MVTLANTPEDLRDDLARRLDAVPAQRPREGRGPSAWLGLLRQVADGEGRLDVEHVADALRRAGEPVAAMAGTAYGAPGKIKATPHHQKRRAPEG